MSQRPQDTSAEEPDGGNPHIRFWGGPGLGNRPGLLNSSRAISIHGAAGGQLQSFDRANSRRKSSRSIRKPAKSKTCADNPRVR